MEEDERDEMEGVEEGGVREGTEGRESGEVLSLNGSS